MSKQQESRSRPEDFDWDEDEWVWVEEYKPNVLKMVPAPTLSRAEKMKMPFKAVVKKVAVAEKGSAGHKPPLEVAFLNRMPDCNRIVKPFHASYNEYARGKHTWNLIFEAYELGDLRTWRNDSFVWVNDEHVAKIVPEAHLWRFLVQMTQALAVVHGQEGSTKKHRGTLLHLDIKPENVLVAHNGSVYPSFKLHDFDFAEVVYGREDRRAPAFRGTFIWHPPEGPDVRTSWADVWAVGAVLHWMAFGEKVVPPMKDDWLDDVSESWEKTVIKYQGKYASDRRLYDALGPRIVSPINLGSKSQIAEMNSEHRRFAEPLYRPKYSDRLNFWMMECLKFDKFERITVDRLMKEMVPEARAALMSLGGEKALTDFELVFT